jgi:ADP-dependent NAD(P)H-hydrate dehydratase
MSASDDGGADITVPFLRDWPLPMPGQDGDKEVRGHVLVVAGAREMPGAVLLAATAALRAGAGKLTVATAASIAIQLGTALPEARVIGLADTAAGGFGINGARALQQAVARADAVLIGPGMQDEAAIAELVLALLPHCAGKALILDAAAMGVVRAPPGGPLRFDSPVLLTPHAGELAQLSGADKAQLAAEPEPAARAAAQRWQCAVALKGALTVIATPAGRLWRHRGGNIGLAISGSGDTLAGIIAGLAARGAPLEQAAAWGVALHAAAGEQLALRHGPLGYLAREIGAEVPVLLRAWGGA